MSSTGDKLRTYELVVPKAEEDGDNTKGPCRKRILRDLEGLQSLIGEELHDGGSYEDVLEVHQSAKQMLQQLDRSVQMARERERQREKAELYHRHGKVEAAFTIERFQLQEEITQLKQEVIQRTANLDATVEHLMLERANSSKATQELTARLGQREAAFAEERGRLSQERHDLEQSYARRDREREDVIAVQVADLGRLKQEKEELARLHKVDRDTVVALEKKLEQEQEKLLCKICYTRPRDGLIFPCMHFEYCFLCVQDHKTRNNSCPACRGSIDGLLKSNQYTR